MKKLISSFMKAPQPRPELQSQVINFLRFPLIICLVFFHSSSLGIQIGDMIFEINPKDMPVNYYSMLIFSGPLAFRNHFFFFVSGFLFFSSIKQLDLSIYKNKIRNRVNSMLVPYLFWNLTAFAVYFTLQNIPQLNAFTNKDIQLQNFFSYFWNNFGEMRAEHFVDFGSKNYPIASQFWFIRDLMIAALISPAIYFFCKYTKIYGVLLIGILWYFGWWLNITGFASMCIFFFTAGAYFGINKRNLIEDFGKVRNLSFVLYPAISIVYCLLSREFVYRVYVHHALIVIGIVFAFNFVAYLFEKEIVKSVPKFLASATFFVFASHELLIKFFRKVAHMIILPENDLEFTALFFLSAIMVIFCALGIYYISRLILPKFTRIITGGR